MNLNSQKGFTLAELSLVLLIMGIVAVGYISSLQFSENYNATEITNTRMNAIEDAFVIYLSRNGRLPCPAAISQSISNSTFGKEQRGVGPPSFCITTNTNIMWVDLGGVGGEFYGGAVPTRELGLSDEHMFDGWGNRFAYFVQQHFINNATTNASCTTGNAASDANFLANTCFRGQASGSINAGTSDIEIRDSFGGNIISNDAVYVLVSYGQNGYGAYYRGSDINYDGGGTDGPNSNRKAYPPNTNDGEQENLECNPTTNVCTTITGLNLQFVQAPPSPTFDDIVRFRTRNQMVTLCNTYLNNECTNTFDIQLN